MQASEDEKLGKEKQFQMEVEFTKSTIESQIASLELLTNLCTSEDWEDEMTDEDAPAFPPELQEFCKRISLPRLFLMCPSPQSPVMQALENSPAVFSEMIDFYEDRTYRSLTAIANIFNVVDPTQFSVPVGEIWNQVGVLVNAFGDSKHLKSLEGSVAAMRSFLCNCPSLEFLGANDVDALRNLTANPFSAEIRSCAISILIHVNKNSERGDMVALGNILKAKLSDESLTVVNEALNGLFDVFGEDDAAPFCSQLQLASTLRQFLPQLKKRIRQGQ